MSDEELIENRRQFLRGITKPDDWVDRLCDLAHKGAELNAAPQAAAKPLGAEVNLPPAVSALNWMGYEKVEECGQCDWKRITAGKCNCLMKVYRRHT
jgi:hypothetical protein